MPSIPTLVIAGSASNVGKTTVVCALAAALRARGLDVRLFKSGPDYLDPTWHEAATGRPSRNLDTWMLDDTAVLASFARGAAGGDLAIVEGSMGLFDGADPESLAGSSAHLAQVLGAPIVLVLDAGAMARSVAAVAEGFARHAPGIQVLGVICNRVGSAGHTTLLRRALTHANGHDGRPLRFLGAFPQQTALSMPARHLGLRAAGLAMGSTSADEVAAWRLHVGRLGEDALEIDALVDMAISCPVPLPEPGDGPGHRSTVLRIGIARDEAFHFYYRDNLDLLRGQGADLVEFSPLRDQSVPPDLDGVVIGGGYPEEHGAELAANAGMLSSLRHLAGRGVPIYGECGGLMYLGQRLVDRQGRSHAMCGLLPIQTAMQDHLVGFGYRTLTLASPCLLGPAGLVLKGHEFHWSSLQITDVADTCFELSWQERRSLEGYQAGSVLGTYVHVHWGSCPASAAAFVQACLQARLTA